MSKYSSTDAFAPLLPLSVLTPGDKSQGKHVIQQTRYHPSGQDNGVACMITPRFKSEGIRVIEHMHNHLVTHILHPPLLLSVIMPIFEGA